MAIIYPFKTKFLSDFSYENSIMPLQDDTLKELDHAISSFEKSILDPNLEKNLISKNELFASFAISKAENSILTLTEAREIWRYLDSNPSYDFITSKLSKGEKLNQRDHDKLEFLNIVKTFRKYNEKIYELKEYTPALILSIHEQLTAGMDIFAKYLPDFDLYKSGQWRDNNLIRVGEYKPQDYASINISLEEILHWLSQTPPIPLNVGIFHTALYAIHPFNNGNKRVCRILEHILYRTFGFNSRNMYGTSYYYHTEKERYYKNLLYSITRTNLNQFGSYSLEALAYSMLGVFKTSWEMRKETFLSSQIEDPNIRKIFKPLIKRHEIQFKTLVKMTGKKITRPTLVTYLQKATIAGTLRRRVQGKAVYYSLNTPDSSEAQTFYHWLSKLQAQLTYIPPEYKRMTSNE